MKHRQLISGLVIILAITGCAGQGSLPQESRDVSDFATVVFRTDGRLNIVQGGAESLTVQAAEDILPLIDTQVRDGILTIQFNDESANSLLGTHRITYSLVVEDLTELEVDGKGMVDITNLTTDRLEVRIIGSAIVSASGKATRQEIAIAGMGHYTSPDMASEETVVVDDYGLVTVWAMKLLDVTLTSMGKVYYYGSPEVVQSITGGGRLVSRGSR